MATYAIGDIQGSYKEFRQLLDLINLNSNDRLWLVGDIVNRGPDSLKLLRFLRTISDAVIIVLGNHDLHLLMVAEGCVKAQSGDTLQDILNAPDRDELLHWLRNHRLLHISDGYVMVHAGLLPSWSVTQAAELAKEAESFLHGKDQSIFLKFCSRLYGNYPNKWDDNLKGYDRIRVIINALTRMRICTYKGRMDLSFKGGVKDIPIGYLPWFDVPSRASKAATIICGHWSALSLHVRSNLIALDTGCVWGGNLTAIRLEDRKIFQVPCARRFVGITC
ncbi:MAG: diadenosine tetraphosphatase [Nitrosomonadaceae bacterium]|nr:diadenosine tetraphosphatase [Nitrosomonadaceae bacterium]|tara:strand:+ start:386 stop:1216 length:831 start_codon:yes stop_codon:yes gene_type:complete